MTPPVTPEKTQPHGATWGLWSRLAGVGTAILIILGTYLRFPPVGIVVAVVLYLLLYAAMWADIRRQLRRRAR